MSPHDPRNGLSFAGQKTKDFLLCYAASRKLRGWCVGHSKYSRENKTAGRIKFMRITTKRVLRLFALATSVGLQPVALATGAEFIYEYDGVKYPYTVVETGDNYTFEFSKNPKAESGRLKAALHVFQSVYGDDSIASQYSEFFMKETARCFSFNGRFYTYRVCFLPNDYSPENKDRFWGFTNRLPNAMWFITRNILPLLLVAAVLYFVLREKRPG